MHLIETLSTKATETGLAFLIIGDNAVMAHGFVRSTGDLDVLVPKTQREAWWRLIEVSG